MDAGKELRRNRIEKKMSLTELAESAGVSRRALSYWESGERIMSVESADKVFSALGATLTIGAR